MTVWQFTSIFKRLSDLEKLIRLPGKFKYFEHNVAAHSFKVTKIAQYLATLRHIMVMKLIGKVCMKRHLIMILLKCLLVI